MHPSHRQEQAVQSIHTNSAALQLLIIPGVAGVGTGWEKGPDTCNCKSWDQCCELEWVRDLT